MTICIFAANLDDPPDVTGKNQTSNMRDYTNRLISLSWQYLSAGECQARARADINPDFRFCDLRAKPGDGEYFDPDTNDFRDLTGPDGHFFDCLQIDLLRPSFDYLSLKYSSLLYILLDCEYLLADKLEARGIVPEWSTIKCTTADDSPISAYRRTIVFPNVGFNAVPVTQTPRPDDMPIELLEQLEDDLEQEFRRRMVIEHYA